MQTYAPYRTKMLSREELKDLSELNPSIIIRDTLIDWLVIIAAWTFVALYPGIWTVLLAIPVIGSRYYGLLIIAHDGLHRRLFKSAKQNDLWNDGMILGAIGAITRLNRINHMEHHRVTCLPDDPDRFKYTHENKETTFDYLLFLSGLRSLLSVFKNVFLKKKTEIAHEERHYQLRDILIIAGWQIVLIGGLTYFIGWWAYPVLWLAPVYLFAYRADLTRVFAEHSMLIPDDEADRKMRMITYESNWLERQFFAPHNMNNHISHHLWTSIPYYNLPAAERIVQKAAETDDNLVWRKSYLRYLIDYWTVWIAKKHTGKEVPA